MAKGFIEVIESENKELASNVLRDALIEDPMFQYMFKDPNRSSLTKMFFNYIIYKSYSMKEYLIGIRNGQTLTSVAVVETPCSIKGKQIFKRLGFILKSIIFLMKLPKASTKFILQYMKITTTARPKSNHHYLVCIGVDPMHQKNGYGRETLNHIHEIVDKDPYSKVLV